MGLVVGVRGGEKRGKLVQWLVRHVILNETSIPPLSF